MRPYCTIALRWFRVDLCPRPRPDLGVSWATYGMPPDYHIHLTVHLDDSFDTAGLDWPLHRCR